MFGDPCKNNISFLWVLVEKPFSHNNNSNNNNHNNNSNNHNNNNKTSFLWGFRGKPMFSSVLP